LSRTFLAFMQFFYFRQKLKPASAKLPEQKLMFRERCADIYTLFLFMSTNFF